MHVKNVLVRKILKNITILIPKLKPPFAVDIINSQMDSIIKQLEKRCNLRIIWVVFPPNRINEVKEKSYDVIDYHNFHNALEILDITQPDLILMEGSFGQWGSL